MRAELEEKAAAAGTTVEEQIKEIKSAAENSADSAEKLSLIHIFGNVICCRHGCRVDVLWCRRAIDALLI